jgi:hypothetical protein
LIHYSTYRGKNIGRMSPPAVKEVWVGYIPHLCQREGGHWASYPYPWRLLPAIAPVSGGKGETLLSFIKYIAK